MNIVLYLLYCEYIIENVIKVISSYYNRSDDYKQLLYMSTSHQGPIIQYFHPPN